MTLIDFPTKPELQKRLDEIEFDNCKAAVGWPIHASDGLGKPYGDINGAVADPPNRDAINPDHYKTHPSGVECIQITEHMNFCCGNAVKYIWRHAMKGGSQDLEKAIWYLQRELRRNA
jgi:hypothetical protein